MTILQLLEVVAIFGADSIHLLGLGARQRSSYNPCKLFFSTLASNKGKLSFLQRVKARCLRNTQKRAHTCELLVTIIGFIGLQTFCSVTWADCNIDCQGPKCDPSTQQLFSSRVTVTSAHSSHCCLSYLLFWWS